MGGDQTLSTFVLYICYALVPDLTVTLLFQDIL